MAQHLAGDEYLQVSDLGLLTSEAVETISKTLDLKSCSAVKLTLAVEAARAKAAKVS